MISDIEDYFAKGCGRCRRFDTPSCSTKLWAPGLTRLREICRASGLVETVKWGHPCYVHGSRNVAIIGAFQRDFRLSFFNAALMKDPAGILERAGPNTRQPDMIRFTSNDGPDRQKDVIRAYLAEATGYAEAGMKPQRDESAPELPRDLVEALDADPELAEAYHALTRGRQRSYVIHLSGAKTAETRRRRILDCRDRIMAGRGATER